MNDQISHFTLLGSPYEQTENDTMDDWYERYKLDPAGIGTLSFSRYCTAATTEPGIGPQAMPPLLFSSQVF